MDFKIYHPIIQPAPSQQKTNKQTREPTRSFNDILQAEIADKTTLKMSKHAEQRFRERGITLSDNMWGKVEHAVQNANSKGVKEALVLTKDAALVVSTTKKLIITALDRKSAGEHVFTNIDGTIVINE